MTSHDLPVMSEDKTENLESHPYPERRTVQLSNRAARYQRWDFAIKLKV